MKPPLMGTSTFGVFASLLLVAPAVAAEPTYDETYARVSALKGELEVSRAERDERASLELNDLLLPGDQLETGAGSFVELELPSATFIRLSAGTSAVLVAIAPVPELTLLRGSAIISRSGEPPEASLIAATAAVTVSPGAMLRADHDPRASVLGVHALRDGVRVRANGEERTLLAPNALTYARGEGRVDVASSEVDAFGAWNLEREALVRRTKLPDALAQHYPGYYDLEGYGEWIVVDGHRYWRPRVAGVWRPYADGRWVWFSAWGWTWVPRTSWGFVTHHYGRWLFVAGHGWCWAPHRSWGPGWVRWASFDDHLGWAPCDFSGHVVHGRGRGRAEPRVWTYAHRDDFRNGAPGFRSRVEIATPDSIDQTKLQFVQDPRRELAPERQPRPALGARMRPAEPKARALAEPEQRPTRSARAAETPNRRAPSDNVDAQRLRRGESIDFGPTYPRLERLEEQPAPAARPQPRATPEPRPFPRSPAHAPVMRQPASPPARTPQPFVGRPAPSIPSPQRQPTMPLYAPQPQQQQPKPPTPLAPAPSKGPSKIDKPVAKEKK